MTHLTLLLALQLGTPAVAVSVVGTVEVDNGAASLPLQRFDEVPEGSTVVTHADGRLTLRLADGTELRLGPSTRLSLGKLETRSPPANRTSRVKLITGRIWAGVMGLFGSEARFEVETDNAVAGVRGTGLFATREGKTSSFILGHGAADVERDGARDRLAGPGAGVEVGEGGGTRLLQLDRRELDRLRRDVGGSALLLADTFVQVASRRTISAARAFAGADAGRSRFVNPGGLVDSPVRAFTAADQIRGTAEITVRVRLPN